MSADWQEFEEAFRAALASFVAGDAGPYAALWSTADDVTVFGGFGGRERGWADVRPRLEWAAARYRGGRASVETISTIVGADLACTVTIESSSGSGEDPARPKDLRVTQVARLENGRWRFIHRHADPFRPTAAPA
ncbi:MAG: nuclear transport factor 2 family protein [Candidatus Dormibacteria bacterium]